MTSQERFLYQHKKFHRCISLAQTGLFILLLILWETAARCGWIDSFFFCSPQYSGKLLCQNAFGRRVIDAFRV